MKLKCVIAIVFLSFGFLFIYRSVANMRTFPLHDYDEANRSEGARNMLLHDSFLAPLTGSPYGRTAGYEVPYSPESIANIWPHYERPPLTFILMAGSSAILGDSELSYRLPSFVFGLATLVILGLIFLKNGLIAGSVGLLILMTSSDWWLSSQYAQLDIIFTFFLIGSITAIFLFVERGDKRWRLFSGIMLGLAILARGQSAILIIFPLFSLLLTKKIKWLDVASILVVSALVSSPWLLGIAWQFGVEESIRKILDLTTSRAILADPTQVAPVYWYARLWLDTLRPGFILLLSLSIVRVFAGKKLNWKQTALAFYFVGGFVLFSLAKNSVWWYVLPLISGVAWLTSELLHDYLIDNKNWLTVISIIVIIASLPIMFQSTTTRVLIYGVMMEALAVMLLFWNASIRKEKHGKVVFVLALIASLGLFYIRFPAPQPTYPETKEVASAYQELPEPKCLMISEMPYEAALFYSRAGEITYLDPELPLRTDCTNYLITRSKLEYPIISRQDPIILYRIPSDE